jgi:hypothetical protein|tara:strand:+ start:301 stop:402 length:102 start_codon:yes stop_codon:yes gene_type:complete
LEEINLIDENFLNNFDEEFPLITEIIIAGISNE